ncbi:MAG: hypothetical protein M3178_09705 [Pseudomonadota bacterium]|nr:hypothetical protein [Pseudomonadota bacterium]
MKKIDYTNPAACPACSLRSRCTTNLRRISRLENEAVLDCMAAVRLKAMPGILHRRREIVEHPFGSIKQWMNQGVFLMRGLDNVRAGFRLGTRVQSATSAQHSRRRDNDPPICKSNGFALQRKPIGGRITLNAASIWGISVKMGIHADSALSYDSVPA